MENTQRPRDLILAKAFDMKIKQKEMKTIYIDESTQKLQLLYILKGKHVYAINIITKQLKELDFSKNHPVVHICGNNNNKYLLILFQNGKLFAVRNIDSEKEKKIIYIKNINTMIENDVTSTYKLYSSDNIDKIIIINDSVLTLWVKTSSKLKKNKNVIEYIGNSTHIQLSKERKNLIQNSNENYTENFYVLFGNNFYLGSYARVFYVICEDIEELNATKIYIIDYVFKFDKENKFKHLEQGSDSEESSEYKKYFESKYVYTYYLPRPLQNSSQNGPCSYYLPPSSTPTPKTLIIKGNYTGTTIAIVINNCPNVSNANMRRKNNTVISLILFQCDTYKFTSFSLDSVIPQHMKTNNVIVVTDVAWINNDVFMLIQFSNHCFIVLNQNFTPVSIYEGTRYISQIKNANEFYILNSFVLNSNANSLNNSIGSNESGNSNVSKITLLSSMNKSTNYVMMFSPSYAICFYCYTKNYENRILSYTASLPSTFNEFLLQLKYFQSSSTSEFNRMSLLDTMHNFIFNYFNVIFKSDYETYNTYNIGNNILNSGNDVSVMNQNGVDPIPLFSNFVMIFRSLNQSHETNLTLISYLLCVANDFFFYLISIKEIWLCFMFVKLSEKYLLRHLQLKQPNNKNYDRAIIQKQRCFMLYNPYITVNRSLRCYNKISNCILHSKLRLLLIFYSLIEFRNSQALNINVLYFVLAKAAIDKLKRKKLIDDISFILKTIIRNWKFLKGENAKVGSEEYVLNGLTLNYKSEILSAYTASAKSVPLKTTIDFDFFKEFYIGDDLTTFTDLNEIYCRGDEENLINEYGYMNNIGIVQKWMLFFVNFFYTDMFDDFKSYLDNHLKQTENSGVVKPTENISPEEMNLSKLIFFNLYFMINLLDLFLIKMIEFLSIKKNCDDQTMLDSFTTNFIHFVSPVDVPFIIYEFYNAAISDIGNAVASSSRCEKEQSYIPKYMNSNEINVLMFSILERYRKEFNMSIYDGIEFIEFIALKGFENSNSSTQIQKYIYSSLLFVIVSMVKMNNFSFFIKYKEQIKKGISSLSEAQRREIYEMIVILINSKLKTMIDNEQQNDSIFEQLSTALKELIYDIIKKEDVRIRDKIFIDFINDSYANFNFAFKEGIMYYEYKALKGEITKAINKEEEMTHILNTKEKSNFIDMIYITNSYEDILYKSIFDKTAKQKMKISLTNFLYMSKETQNLITNVDSLKIILTNAKTPQHSPQLLTKEKNIQKLINITMIKFIYTFTALYLKFTIIQLSKENIGKFLKFYSLYIIFKSRSDYISKMKIVLSYITTVANLNDIEMKSNLKSIIKNFLYGNIIHCYDNAKFINEIENIVLKDQNILSEYEKLQKRNTEESEEEKETLPSNEIFTKSKKIKQFIFLLDNDLYKDTVNEVIAELNEYIDKVYNSNVNEKSTQREKFTKLNLIFEELTGINRNNVITLTTFYEYKNNQAIYDIISGKSMNNQSKNNFDIKGIYEDRQKVNFIKKKPTNKVKKLTETNNNNSTTLVIYDDEAIEDSIDIREEKVSKENKLKIKEKDSEISSTSSQVQIKPKSKSTVVKVDNQSMTMHHKVKKLIRKIKRIIFTQFMNGIFIQMKSQIDERELEQIEMINFTPSEGKFESTLLTEKYISFKDLENSKNEEYNANINTINSFDILKLNKVRQGKGNKSKIYKELLKHRTSRKLNNIIRNKVGELNEKLIQFEEMTKQLGKNFVTNINK